MYRTSRRSFKRTTFRRRSSFRRSSRPMRKMVARTAQRVINNNLEKKYQDLSFNATIPSDGSAIQKLTSITQGTGDSSRIGDKIRVLSWKCRFQFVAADTTNAVRMILFQWHPDDNVSTPILGNILQQINYTSYYNHDQGNLFSVFFDKTYTLQSSDMANRVTTQTYRFGKKTGKMRWIKQNIKFNGNTPTGSDNLYCIFVSDSTAGPHPTVNGSSRLVYTDA